MFKNKVVLETIQTDLITDDYVILYNMLRIKGVGTMLKVDLIEWFLS